MTATTYTALSNWDASARYTAPAVATDVVFSNVPIQGGGWQNPAANASGALPSPMLRFTTTTSDTAPTITPSQAIGIAPGALFDMRANANERIWFAVTGASSAAVTIEV